jgi:hypothetical protein
MMYGPYAYPCYAPPDEWGWAFGHPYDPQRYVLHDGPPPLEWWNGPEHPGWSADYAWPHGPEFAGLDLGSLPQYGREWAEKFGEKLGTLGTAAEGAWKNLSQGVSSGLPSFKPFGEVTQKASTAADEATLAAAEARRSIAAVRDRATRTLDQVDRTAKEHEETVKIAKYVLVGLGVLGGTALLYSMVK